LINVQGSYFSVWSQFAAFCHIFEYLVETIWKLSIWSTEALWKIPKNAVLDGNNIRGNKGRYPKSSEWMQLF